jgi:NDP-sugar pyrophosphorylase family protein
MQIMIPMGGAGSRFSAAGYDRPKPFIEFHNSTMIENVIENLGCENDYVLIAQKMHYEAFRHVFDRVAFKVKSLQVATLDGITRGAAESCLFAENFLNHDLPLMIANSDQMMHWNSVEFKAWFLDSGLDGAIMTFDSQSEKNSYAEVNDHGLVVRTAEKQVISKHATNGIYVWRKAGDFFKAAREMISKNLRFNNEFYVCPVYNINIAWKQKIGIYHIDGHWPIGTPQDLTAYLDYMATKS